MSDLELGARGEDAAAAFLERLGMTIVERNWRCKAGEIDIVGLEGETLVLIEVKTRRTATKGSPEEAVSPTKQKKLVRLAREYVAKSGLEPQEIRFDVIGVVPISQDRALLRHHKAAFGA